MKKTILSLLCVTFLAATALSQITNLVKISALPTAGALTGAEIIPLNQSGATVTATLAQILAAAEIQTTTASNYFMKASGTNTANIVTVSNNVTSLAAFAVPVSNSIVTLSNGVYAVSNRLTSANVALTAVSNTVNTATANITAANAAISALQGATNGLQGQITTIDTQLGSTPGAGGTATFARVLTPTYLWPNAISVSGSGMTNNINFANGTFQKVYCGWGGLTGPCYFQPINFSDGDNVWLEVVCTNGTSGHVGTFSTVTNGVIDPWTSGTSGAGGLYIILSGSTKTALLNWQVFGTNLIWTASAHP